MQQASRIHRGKAKAFEDVLYHLTGLERDEVALLIEMGGAYVGKWRCKDAQRKIRDGETVSAWWQYPLVMEPVPFDASWILAQPKGLLIANKPVGLPTQGRRDADYMAFYELLKKELGGYLGLHHRLDQGTSGLMMFTRDKTLNKAVSALFEKRLVEKVYVARCEGSWPFEADVAEIDAAIAPERSRTGTRQVVASHGKKALTKVRLLQRLDEGCLVEAQPKTGRTHQIRVHLAHVGLPLWNDSLYGRGDGTFFLHCKSLRWPAHGGLSAGHFEVERGLS